MNSFPSRGVGRLFAFVSFATALAVSALPAADAPASVAAKSTVSAPVTITDNGNSWILENGIVRATVAKRSGQMQSLTYLGNTALPNGGVRASGNWEEDPSAAAQVGGLTQSITIDPTKNGGERAEVSVKGVTGGQVPLSVGSPGQTNGTANIDLEIRCSLGRGDSGIYTYAIFSHPAAYGPASIGESRFIIFMNQDFDWISVDKDRNMLECAPRDWGTGVVVHAKEQRVMSQGYYQNSVEHKYSYSAVQYTTPAYGWSSTKNHLGIWFINPTTEYLSGGATKQELDCHYGDGANPGPIILDYWRGTHYGRNTSCNIAAGEEWSKVVGPIFVYINALDSFKTPSQADLDTLAATAGNPTVPAAWKDNATALWQDALDQAKVQSAKWPYDWVSGVDYPHLNERGNVTGQLVLNDPLAPAPLANLANLTVGLAHPDYANPNGTGYTVGQIDWTRDAKYYEFWSKGTADGKFSITKVRPGNYTLHAFADGVLGEFAQANITVEAGKDVDLGKLEWKPVRYGTQLWEIGYPDRNADKFYKGDGDNYWLWGWNLRYALLYPNDLTYTVGKSDYHKDWFFEEVPHATADPSLFVNPAAKDPANQRFGWVKAESLDQYPQTDQRGPWAVYGQGRATTWTIKFNVDKAVQGSAVLRLALAGADGGGGAGSAGIGLAVGVNGQSVGSIQPIMGTNAIRYNTTHGAWQELHLTFDASLLKPGENEMTLTVPGGDLQSGVVYDYLRLELNQYYKPDGTPLTPPKS
jgi:rhamnogalacturonan endolyase